MIGRLARIFPRLLLFNVLLVFLPVAGLLYLDTYEQQLLASQERAMVQQGRLLAAALGESGELVGEEAVALLARLEQRIDARLRIVDADGLLLADSSRLGPRREPGAEPPLRSAGRSDWLYRLGASVTQTVQRLLHPSEPRRLGSGRIYDGASRLGGREIKAALAGRYGATTRISSGGQRSVTLYSAIPVRDSEQVVGAVLVSQSTARLLSSLIEIRLDIFQAFLASVAVAVVLSLLFATTVARPLSRLQQQAVAIVDRRGRLKRRFDGSKRHDEIGELARALESLSGRIESYQGKLEAFASDVAHELKNPLASIRSATELVHEVEDPANRQRFLEIVEHDVARMEHVLSEVRELATLDAGNRGPTPVADLESLTREVLDGYRQRTETTPTLELTIDGEPARAAIEPEQFSRVLGNLLDNAISFTPDESTVQVRLENREEEVLIAVHDQGPGIPKSERARVFDRFYSLRPKRHRDNGHLGLGLAIVRAIVESYGGDITHTTPPEGGAAFTVRLPHDGS